MKNHFGYIGYHPIFQRKNFEWIFNEFFLKDSKNKYSFKQVLVFKNKLIIDSYNKINMILCKNKSDCVRLYNVLEEESKKNKLKYVMFAR